MDWTVVAIAGWLLSGLAGGYLCTEWYRCYLDMSHPQYAPHSRPWGMAVVYGLTMGPAVILIAVGLFLFDPPHAHL